MGMEPMDNFTSMIQPINEHSGIFYNELGNIGNHVSDYTFLTGFTIHEIPENIDLLQHIYERSNRTILSSN